MLKFYNHLLFEAQRFFDIKGCEFEYGNGKTATYFFSGKPKKEILVKGPELIEDGHVKNFKKKHRSAFVKGGRFYAKEKVNFSLKEFFEMWKKKNSSRMTEMSVSKLEIVN